MNLIDTNGVHYVFTKNFALQNNYYLAPDVEEEVEMTQIIHGKGLPARISKIIKSGNFDEAIYLKHYSDILNKYGGRSFYNMTGFGDVSILAATLMLIEVSVKQKLTQLFPNFEQVTIYTDDNGLIKKIKKELAGKNILLRPSTDIS
jgi:hypothetical protein